MKIRILAGTILVLSLGLGSARAQTPAPVSPLISDNHGLLVVEVKFAADGTVVACRIARSNLPYPLETGTIDYIRRKWVNSLFAGETVHFPIIFDELPWYAKQWESGVVAPPNFLPAGAPGRKLKLRVTFGPDGWAQRVEVREPSGDDRLDRETAVWVKVHWHDAAYEGKTVDAPFHFQTPIMHKSVVANPHPQPQLVAPAEPAEPAAAPAVRVE